MGRLRELFEAHDGRLIDKWAHYFYIYERYFAEYVGKRVRVLEIGVAHGGSLQLWKKYFGVQAEIVGVDIEPRCKDYEEEQITICTMNQADLNDRLRLPFPSFDIVIDDGSHHKIDQQASFKAMWPRTRGVYIIEDCHNGYPDISAMDGFIASYPWVLAIFRPERVVRGLPSRPLNAAEQQVYVGAV